MSEVMVNFIAFNEARDTCQMVLVEGPWDGEIEDHLRSLQDRMFGCLNAALDGHLAAQFPEAKGLNVVIRVDCYDVQRDEVEAFFGRFTDGVATMSDYSTTGSPFVRQFLFEVSFDTVADA
ncbi:hypothetical protein U1701_11260 [Sphingomonas sp. PB2P19]|uniref:hypothetical protein n=1 Tax=Sphingomonas rhamnosi TaxID=3096156 RepID=UPI002FC6B1A5